VALLFILVFDGVMTFVILKLISIFIPLRMTPAELEVGDEAIHGDAAYELMPAPPMGLPSEAPAASPAQPSNVPV
jgi:Amt family ammonium transporter